MDLASQSNHEQDCFDRCISGPTPGSIKEDLTACEYNSATNECFWFDSDVAFGNHDTAQGKVCYVRKGIVV